MAGDGSARSTARAAGWLAAAAVFLIVLGARWSLIADYGSSVPFLDQWNGEAHVAYVPYLHGRLGWLDLFAPHNEHRAVVPRVEGLVLLIADGQWNPLSQMVLNAVVMAGAVMALVLAVGGLGGFRSMAAAGAVAVLCFSSPASWENTLAAFQAPFFWLDLATFIGLYLVLIRRPGSPGWVAGATALFLGLFTVATGLVAPIAAGLAVFVRDLCNRSASRETAITVAVALGIAASGWLLLPDTRADLPAAAAGAFLQQARLAARSLAWPFVTSAWMAALIWLPSALLMLRALRRRAMNPMETYILALAAWVVAHALAMAWARGSAYAIPPSRYVDVLAVGPVINAAALAGLWSTVDEVRWRRLLPWAVAAWAATLALGVTSVSREARSRGATERAAWTRAYAEHIRRLGRDGDLGRFSALRFPDQVPWINARDLAMLWLYEPALRVVLPPAIRDPLPLVSDGNSVFAAPGIAPGTPSREDATIGSFADGPRTVGHFRSAPMTCTAGGWLRMEVAGEWEAADVSLALVPADGTPRPVRLPAAAPERWQVVYAQCPDEAFRVVAEDAAPAGWIAVGAPVEIGPIGRAAEQAAPMGGSVMWAGLLTAAAAAAAAWRGRRLLRPHLQL